MTVSTQRGRRFDGRVARRGGLLQVRSYAGSINFSAPVEADTVSEGWIFLDLSFGAGPLMVVAIAIASHQGCFVDLCCGISRLYMMC